VTDRESSDYKEPAPPQDAAQGEAPETHPDAPSPIPPPWERQQPPAQPQRPSPAGSYQGQPGPAERSAQVHATHRTEAQHERTNRPPPPSDDNTMVWPRREFQPPPVLREEDAPGGWGDRGAPPRQGRPPRPGAETTGPQRPVEPQPSQWAEGPQRGDVVPARQPESPRWAPAVQGDDLSVGAANWSYVDSIRTSELVRARKTPPGRGWRRLVFKATGGLVNPGQSPAERRQADLEAKIRSLLRGRYKIAVVGKGGTGKSTIAACIGSIYAQLRQDDRVVAIDADTAFGKLGSRIDPNVAGSYWELASDQYLHSFADVRSRVGSNASGLFVLAGEAATARRRTIDPAIYREATTRLDNHFTISIVDCGTQMDHDVTKEVLRDVDALIVVSSPWVDGASAAGQAMEWLANIGYTGLLHRTVVVLNDSDGHADKRTRTLLKEQFGSRGQVVIEMPYDPHLRPGGVIDVDNELNNTTRRRLFEIAAAIAEHFPATTEGPRR
jgi:MinD-like ATPase involved in chromosome partitioning or flagellar assembly